MADIFVSYAREDRERIEPLVVRQQDQDVGPPRRRRRFALAGDGRAGRQQGRDPKQWQRPDHIPGWQ